MKAPYPAVKCDGGGLGHLVGSETQLPPGWTGDKPSDRGDEHFCPRHSAERAS